MKTIQVTIDEPLLKQADECSKSLRMRRSAFIRLALRHELDRRQATRPVREHAEACRLQPPETEELADWESIQDWGDDWET
jgi:metal-responsive CopG/Arc/MetJ family transcriptional regulator